MAPFSLGKLERISSCWNHYDVIAKAGAPVIPDVARDWVPASQGVAAQSEGLDPAAHLAKKMAGNPARLQRRAGRATIWTMVRAVGK